MEKSAAAKTKAERMLELGLCVVCWHGVGEEREGKEGMCATCEHLYRLERVEAAARARRRWRAREQAERLIRAAVAADLEFDGVMVCLRCRAVLGPWESERRMVCEECAVALRSPTRTKGKCAWCCQVGHRILNCWEFYCGTGLRARAARVARLLRDRARRQAGLAERIEREEDPERKLMLVVGPVRANKIRVRRLRESLAETRSVLGEELLEEERRARQRVRHAFDKLRADQQ